MPLDVNECSRGDSNTTISSNVSSESELCGKESICINTPGSYRCECRPGYEGNAIEECFDINECISGSACGINAKCFNVPGSFKCLCPKGFTGDPYKFCESMTQKKNLWIFLFQTISVLLSFCQGSFYFVFLIFCLKQKQDYSRPLSFEKLDLKSFNFTWNSISSIGWPFVDLIIREKQSSDQYCFGFS